MDKDAIIGAVTGVTKKWAKQRKAEERHARAETKPNPPRAVFIRRSPVRCRGAGADRLSSRGINCS